MSKAVPLIPDPEAKGRLLRAACAVFAEQGFRGATVRAICRQAQVNVAAVGYYFGSKEALYAEALKASAMRSVALHPLDAGLAADAPWEAALGAVVHAFISRVLAEGEGSWYGRMISREMVEPSAALQDLVEEVIRPQAQYLWAVVRRALGDGADEAQVRAGAYSVVAQCVFHHQARPMMARLGGPGPGAAALIDHVTVFSIAGLRAMAASPVGKGGAL